MAKQPIVLSNGDGRFTFSDTGSVWYDDTSLAVTASSIYTSNLTLANVRTGSLMYVSGGLIYPVVTGTVHGGALVWNSTANQWSASAEIVESYEGTAGGHLQGTFGVSGEPKVINITSVDSGTLRSFNGGTGNGNIPVGKNILLKATSGSFTYLSASADNSGSFVTATSANGWTIAPAAYQPDVRFYTSGSTGNTFTWTKPEGARFARVILQGAGGGGGGGAVTTNVGSGGGSGGFTDIIIEVSSLTSAAVTASIGGNGGAVSGNGTVGGTTSFSSYTAGGGGAGVTNNGAGGTAGVGTTKNGGAGSGTAAAGTVYGMPSGGGKGGAGTVPGTIVPMISNGQRNFGYSLASDGTPIDLTLASGSAGTAGTPIQPGFGAGGGGGAINNAGGKGGNGYALIISW